MSKIVKVVVHVPQGSADMVRSAIGEAGGGVIGNYTFCSFSIAGTGRFFPQKDAKPHIGEIEQFESVTEERIEVTCPQSVALKVIDAIKVAHPYEEPTIDIYPLLSPETL
jgi:hypothetical protein